MENLHPSKWQMLTTATKDFGGKSAFEWAIKWGNERDLQNFTDKLSLLPDDEKIKALHDLLPNVQNFPEDCRKTLIAAAFKLLLTERGEESAQNIATLKTLLDNFCRLPGNVASLADALCSLFQEKGGGKLVSAANEMGYVEKFADTSPMLMFLRTLSPDQQVEIFTASFAGAEKFLQRKQCRELIEGWEPDDIGKFLQRKDDSGRTLAEVILLEDRASDSFVETPGKFLVKLLANSSMGMLKNIPCGDGLPLKLHLWLHAPGRCASIWKEEITAEEMATVGALPQEEGKRYSGKILLCKFISSENPEALLEDPKFTEKFLRAAGTNDGKKMLHGALGKKDGKDISDTLKILYRAALALPNDRERNGALVSVLSLQFMFQEKRGEIANFAEDGNFSADDWKKIERALVFGSRNKYFSCETIAKGGFCPHFLAAVGSLSEAEQQKIMGQIPRKDAVAMLSEESFLNDFMKLPDSSRKAFFAPQSNGGLSLRAWTWLHRQDSLNGVESLCEQCQIPIDESGDFLEISKLQRGSFVPGETPSEVRAKIFVSDILSRGQRKMEWAVMAFLSLAPPDGWQILEALQFPSAQKILRDVFLQLDQKKRKEILEAWEDFSGNTEDCDLIDDALETIYDWNTEADRSHNPTGGATRATATPLTAPEETA
ncbi:MAG: hypothetical protein LBS68_01055 [Puniceicoccales bacterium]|nr:hypothetical protein [Puniceicoccales bacterium]